MSDETEIVRVLRERAARVARIPEQKYPGATLYVLEFKLAGERYAIEVRYIEEVHVLRNFTPLPGAPAFAPGIVSLRGRIVPVVDMKNFLDLPGEGIADLHHAIVVRGPGLEIGLLADDIVGLRVVRCDSLQPLPDAAGDRTEYLQGVTQEPMAVLDLPRMLADPRISSGAVGN